MKESYSEDLASHAGPESYAGDGNIAGVALARGTRRPAIELRNHPFRAPKSYAGRKATPDASLSARRASGTAESETLCMCGNSKRENREVPRVSNVSRHIGTAGKRLRRYSRHVRSWEVRWSHSTCETDEQTRDPGGGVRGGKGATQGKCCSPRGCTGHSAGICKASLHAATAGRDVAS
jgi:hypothetical protein